MSRTLTASDRSRLIRLVSTMEKGSSERRAILAGMKDEKWLRYLRDVFGYSFDVDDVKGMSVKLHRNGLTISHGGGTKRTLKMPRGAGMFWMSEFVTWVEKNGGHEG